MMASEGVEFCSGVTLSSMEGQPPEDWAKMWFQRIHEHYLDPAEVLNQNHHGFAAMTLICSAIEAIGTILTPESDGTGKRFEDTAKQILGPLGENSTVLYKHYRCGLVHNGRTNQSPYSGHRRENELSALDYEANQDLDERSGRDSEIKLFILNPDGTLKLVKEGFSNWFSSESKESIGNRVIAEFADDIEIIKRLDDFGEYE